MRCLRHQSKSMLSTAVCYFMACSTSQALMRDGHGEGFGPWSGSDLGPPPSSPAPWTEAPQLSCLTEPLPTQPGSRAAKNNAESLLDRRLETPVNHSGTGSFYKLFAPFRREKLLGEEEDPRIGLSTSISVPQFPCL